MKLLLYMFIILHTSLAQNNGRRRTIQKEQFKLTDKQVLQLVTDQVVPFAVSQPENCPQNGEVCKECPRILDDYREGRIPLLQLKLRYCGENGEGIHEFCCRGQSIVAKSQNLRDLIRAWLSYLIGPVSAIVIFLSDLEPENPGTFEGNPRRCSDDEICGICESIVDDFENGRIDLRYLKSKYCGDPDNISRTFCCPKPTGATSTNKNPDKVCTTQSGKKCIFPFNQLGKEYRECTLDGNYDGYSCATQIDENGNLTQWGLCMPDCPGYDHMLCNKIGDEEIRKKCFEECENSTGSSEDKQICRSKFEPLTRTTTTRSTTTTTTTTTTEEEDPVTTFEEAVDVIRGYSHSYWLKDFVRRNDINIQDEDGDTVFTWAAILDNLEALESILENSTEDVNINHQNKFGWSALHQAVGKQHSRIVERLLQLPGVDLNLKTTEGYTPLDLANRYEYTEIADMLK